MAPPIVHEVVESRGEPLDGVARAFMEPRFEQSFGHVRVHTDAAAAASVRALGALAYAAGNHLVFGAGQYAPGTLRGKHLLAQELSHVVQQGASTSAPFDGSWLVQRVCDVSKRPTGNAIASQGEADYRAAVRAGKYCKDTGFTGALHPGGRCYREPLVQLLEALLSRRHPVRGADAAIAAA